jgi:hypothetical protein
VRDVDRRGEGCSSGRRDGPAVTRGVVKRDILISSAAANRVQMRVEAASNVAVGTERDRAKVYLCKHALVRHDAQCVCSAVQIHLLGDDPFASWMTTNTVFSTRPAVVGVS